jgi:hypothetical protein
LIYSGRQYNYALASITVPPRYVRRSHYYAEQQQHEETVPHD